MSEATQTATKATVKIGTQMMFKVPFSMLEIEEGANPRENYGDIDELAESIYQNGVKQVLKGRKNEKTGKYTVTDGHRRHRAMAIVFEKHGIDLVANMVIEDKKTTPEQRLLDMYLANDGLPFSPLEVANIVQRFISYGWKYDQIAEKLGKSSIYVRKLEKLAAAPEKLKKLVRDNVISSTYAGELIEKKEVDNFFAKVDTGEIVLDAPVTKPNGSKRATISKGKAGDVKTAMKDMKKYLRETDPDTQVAEEKREFFNFLVRLFDNNHTPRTIKSFFKA